MKFDLHGDWKLVAGILALAGLSLVSGVYGYSKVFPRIEAAHPDHFEDNVLIAQAQGDWDRALKIAKYAVEVRPDDPMAHTVLGRVLLGANYTNEGLAELEWAVEIPRELSDGAYRNTRKYYYFTPARLTLGAYHLGLENPPRAVEQFELARPFSTLSAKTYQDYAEPMYSAYAALGLWNRAVEVRKPEVEELDLIAASDLALISHALMDAEDWDLAERALISLSQDPEFAAEAHFVLGSLYLRQGRFETSVKHFELASDQGNPDAVFWRALALEEWGRIDDAVRTYLETKPNSTFRLFALGKVFMLLDELREATKRENSLSVQSVLDQIDEEVEQFARTSITPANFDRYPTRQIRAVRFMETRLEVAGKVPVLAIWEDTSEREVESLVRIAREPGPDSMTMYVGRTGSIISFQRVENLANWNIVEAMPTDAEVIPGWIDSARDWFALREEPGLHVERNETDGQYLVVGRPGWYYSLPYLVQDDVVYLLAVEADGVQGGTSLGWQFLSSGELVAIENDILQHGMTAEHELSAGCITSLALFDRVRLQIVTRPEAIPVAIHDMKFLAIAVPQEWPAVQPPLEEVH